MEHGVKHGVEHGVGHGVKHGVGCIIHLICVSIWGTDHIVFVSGPFRSISNFALSVHPW